MRRALLLLMFVGCTRESDPIARPVPEKNVAPAPIVAPAMVFDDVRCVYGGTAPAFFVWAEATAKSRVHNLRAKSFEIRAPDAGWVDGTDGAVTLRTRSKKGEGDVGTVPATLEPGVTFHLEVFGAVRLSAFEIGATYPTDARPFRAVLVSDEGTYTLSAICAVGPAG
ncbi:MAG: hypothetical protein ACXVEE_12105 [Polyangiales bacterium]